MVARGKNRHRSDCSAWSGAQLYARGWVKHSNCIGCGLPVLELAGQFENLDSYFIEAGQPDPATAGEWHTVCLVASPFGSAWNAARLRNYREVRGYATVAELADWTIVRRGTTGGCVAFGRVGKLLALAELGSKKKSRRAAGGRVFPVVDEGYNLDVKDREVVDGIRERFAATGSVPLLFVCELLGIRERIWHPEALDRAVVSSIRQSESRHFITMAIEYGVFVPDELLPYVGAGVR